MVLFKRTKYTCSRVASVLILNIVLSLVIQLRYLKQQHEHLPLSLLINKTQSNKTLHTGEPLPFTLSTDKAQANGILETSVPIVHFVTYGSSEYANPKQRIRREAEDTGWFETVSIFGPEDLPISFKEKFKEILKQPRGAGYWIWKPCILQQVLEKMKEGEFLVYADAGCTVNIHGKKRFYEYIELLRPREIDVLGFQMSHPEHEWTTEHIFQAFNISEDNNAIRQSGQVMGTILMLKKGDHSRRWLSMVQKILNIDPWLLTDKYNLEAKQMDANFKDSRHDQSILSVSRKLVGGTIFLSDETWGVPMPKDKPFLATRIRG